MKITRPTFLVDKRRAQRNIQRMVGKALSDGLMLRPHFKTHQSAEIAGWFRQEGITKATVSSVEMAHYFAENGWDDITIAFPYNPLECHLISELAQKIKLSLTIVSKEALDHMNLNISEPLDYLVKVDVGTHRTGVQAADKSLILELAQSGNPQHTLRGFMAHAGHTYKPISPEEALEIYKHSVEQLELARYHTGSNDLLLSYGDTPSCTLLDEFSEIDEIRPGNFVFYDTMQHHFGVATLDDIAVCMACPVVAIHSERGEAVIYGGAVHFSKDYIETTGAKSFGTVVNLETHGWNTDPLADVHRLSQEHGIIKGKENYINSLRIGDLVGVLPVHSCLTADLQDHYVSLDGRRIEKLN